MAHPYSGERIVASIEARMGSSRLPGKVLMDIGGKPALARLVDRLRSCALLDDVVVATSTFPGDDAIADWATSYGVAVYRGSEEDVLQRVIDAQRSMGSTITVEITGDCPLLDPELIDLGIETFFANDCDVACNVKIPSFPQGADVQVFRTDALAEVAATVSDPAVREHVSLYFYENPDRYRTVHMLATADRRAPDVRLQLDYEEDLAFIRTVYARLEPSLGPLFCVPAILDLLENDPAIAALNAHCEEKAVR